MRKLLPLSNISPPCHINWRPSRWLLVALLLLSLLAPLAVLLSGMPKFMSIPLAILALAYGAYSIWQQQQQPSKTLVISYAENLALLRLNDAPIEIQLAEYGPLLLCRWQNIQKQTGWLLWWPDTLSTAQRRELRLAATQLPLPHRRKPMATL